MEKLTAVGWLMQKWYSDEFIGEKDFERAKEMEKGQMKQIMWDLTDIDMTKTNKGLVIDNMFEQYYKENFKSE